MTDVTEALRRASRIGPYFATTVVDPAPGATTMRDADTDTYELRYSSGTKLTDLYRDGTVLAAAVDDMTGRLATGERRVAASTLLLGHAARVWSIILGCWATSGVVPDLDPTTVYLLVVPGSPVELVVTDLAGRRVPVTDEGHAVETIGHVVVDGHLRLFVNAVHTQSRAAPGLLWGNAASSLVGAVRVLGSQPTLVPPDTAAAVRRVGAQLLASAPLAGTTRHETDPDGQLDPDSVVRRSCCLFYRVPGGGTCGDCPLTGSPATAVD